MGEVNEWLKWSTLLTEQKEKRTVIQHFQWEAEEGLQRKRWDESETMKDGDDTHIMNPMGLLEWWRGTDMVKKMNPLPQVIGTIKHLKWVKKEDTAESQWQKMRGGMGGWRGSERWREWKMRWQKVRTNASERVKRVNKWSRRRESTECKWSCRS